MIQSLEVARGHDGFFRGNPEPTVICALFVVSGETVQLAGRSLHRFRAKRPFPGVATPDNGSLPACTLHLETGFPHWVMLAAALEDDGGGDIQRAFGAVERHDTLSVWASDLREFEARPLAALPTQPDWLSPRASQLLSDGEAFGPSCTTDKWVGAACWCMEASESTMSRRHRVPFLSEDRLNDWTALVDVVC